MEDAVIEAHDAPFAPTNARELHAVPAPDAAPDPLAPRRSAEAA